MKRSLAVAMASAVALAAWTAAAGDRDSATPCPSEPAALTQRSEAQSFARSVQKLNALRLAVRSAKAELVATAQSAGGPDRPASPPPRTIEEIDARVAAIERRMDRMEAAMDDVVEMMAEIVMQLLDSTEAGPGARVPTALPAQPKCPSPSSQAP